MNIDQEKLREFAKRYTAAWCSQDPTSVAEFFSPNGSLTVNAGTPAIGRIAIADVARSFMAAFPDLKVVMDDLILKGDKVEYHWTLIGTHRGRGGTGNRVRISGFEVWQIGPDQLIARSHGYFDNDEYQRQLKAGMADR